MTSTANTTDRRRDRWLLLLLALAVALSLYVGAYVAMCTKVDAPLPTGPPGTLAEFFYDGPPVYEAGYRVPACLDSAGAQRICKRVFSPLYAVDRSIRPGFWATAILNAKQIKALEEYAKRTRGTPASAHR